MTLLKFLSVLFENGEQTCFAKSAYDVEITKGPCDRATFFSINAMDPALSRSDKAVTSFRNFLIEIDSLPLEDQIDYVTSKVPVSSIVYSGGKSYHFIISLEEPLDTKEQYDEVAKRLHLLLPLADKTTKNPSRLSRLPFRLREDTGKEQKLIELNGRVTNSVLLDVLPELPVRKQKEYTEEERREFVTLNVLNAAYSPDDTMYSLGLNGRNAFFFWLGKRFEDLNYDEDKKYKYVELAYNNLQDTSNFSFTEACLAARIYK